jgi:hypothetical protein
MKDPKRLVDGKGTDLERLLLDAARNESPTPSLTRRMVRVLGFGLASTMAPAAAAAATATATATAAKVGTGVWISLGVLAAVGAGVASVQLYSPKVEIRPPVAAPAVVNPSSRPPAPVTPELGDEIRLIDRARGALRAGAPELALEELNRYFARHSRGTLEPEAAVLRIEALQQSGRRDDAKSAARHFLRRHPEGPLADRVRQYR